MLIGCFGDCHITKNMRTLQPVWDVTSVKSILSMYDTFDEQGVELVVCLGDFFDAPRIEAKNMNLILPILNSINSRTYPTYFLLGNHEADDIESNILEIIDTYENIRAVTSVYQMENLLFLPYHENPSSVNMKDMIVFTHHDIYGSALAGGKTKAFFGIEPSVFESASLVLNGHVHLRSRVADNLLNAGSLLVSCHGELLLGNYPQYYTIDTKSLELKDYDNEHSMIYLTIQENQKDSLSMYDMTHTIVKVEYENELPELDISPARISYRKLIKAIDDTSSEYNHTSQDFDLKNYVVEFIKKDESISSEEKESYVSIGVKLLS